jgi:hypothetical protein
VLFDPISHDFFTLQGCIESGSAPKLKPASEGRPLTKMVKVNNIYQFYFGNDIYIPYIAVKIKETNIYLMNIDWDEYCGAPTKMIVPISCFKSNTKTIKEWVQHN